MPRFQFPLPMLFVMLTIAAGRIVLDRYVYPDPPVGRLLQLLAGFCFPQYPFALPPALDRCGGLPWHSLSGRSSNGPR